MSGPANREDREFFATLKDEESQTLYRNWQGGVSNLVTLDVWKSEWEKHPDSHKALLFFAAMTINMIRKNPNSNIAESVTAENNRLEANKNLFHWSDTIMEKFSNNKPNLGGEDYFDFDSVQELSDKAQWNNCINYLNLVGTGLTEQVPFNEEKLGIKPEMKQNFEKKISDSAFFNVYDTCYRLNYPIELKEIEKSQRNVSNKLSKINPDWWYDEGLELRSR